MAKKNQPVVFISAIQKTHLEDFRRLLYEEVKNIHITRYPYNHFLYEV